MPDGATVAGAEHATATSPATARKPAQAAASATPAGRAVARTVDVTIVRRAPNSPAALPASRPTKRLNNRDAALSQFLRGDDAMAAAQLPAPSYAPMMAWVIVSFVVLVVAVVATAVILTNSTTKNESPAGAMPNMAQPGIIAVAQPAYTSPPGSPSSLLPANWLKLT